MREPVEFEIDGLTFEFREMPLPDACKALELVSGLIEGAMGGGSPQNVKAAIAATVARAAGKLPQMVAAFVPFCSVEGEAIAGGRKVKLQAFQGDAFNGKLDRAILFVAHCAAAEFGDFLAAGLERLASGLVELAQKYPALQVQIPGSGGSP